jgi:hypothetical protein
MPGSDHIEGIPIRDEKTRRRVKRLPVQILELNYGVLRA